jgi:hypothetical protein
MSAAIMTGVKAAPKRSAEVEAQRVHVAIPGPEGNAAERSAGRWQRAETAQVWRKADHGFRAN